MCHVFGPCFGRRHVMINDTHSPFSRFTNNYPIRITDLSSCVYFCVSLFFFFHIFRLIFVGCFFSSTMSSPFFLLAPPCHLPTHASWAYTFPPPISFESHPISFRLFLFNTQPSLNILEIIKKVRLCCFFSPI